jgi:hypothetical protein
MKAVSMMRIYCQNLPINPLSFGQSAGLMVPKSVRQQVLNDPRRTLPHSSIRLLCERIWMAIHGLSVYKNHAPISLSAVGDGVSDIGVLECRRKGGVLSAQND